MQRTSGHALLLAAILLGCGANPFSEVALAHAGAEEGAPAPTDAAPEDARAPHRCSQRRLAGYDGLAMSSQPRRLEGVHCTITVDSPAPGVVLVTILGTDVGELGDAPFRALAPLLQEGQRVELFIDARGARGPSIDVSNEWARWLAQHRQRLRHASMLTASRFVQLTADFVRRFADLGDAMRIYTDPAVFEGALSNAIGNARADAR